MAFAASLFFKVTMYIKSLLQVLCVYRFSRHDYDAINKIYTAKKNKNSSRYWETLNCSHLIF